jgi:hypothetical protein
MQMSQQQRTQPPPEPPLQFPPTQPVEVEQQQQQQQQNVIEDGGGPVATNLVGAAADVIASSPPVELLEQMTLNVPTAIPPMMTTERPRTASSFVPLSSALPAASVEERRMLQQSRGHQLQRTSTAPSTKQMDPYVEAGVDDKENTGGGGSPSEVSKTMPLVVSANDDVHETKEGVVGSDAPIAGGEGKHGVDVGQSKSFLMAALDSHRLRVRE